MALSKALRTPESLYNIGALMGVQFGPCAEEAVKGNSTWGLFVDKPGECGDGPGGVAGGPPLRIVFGEDPCTT